MCFKQRLISLLYIYIGILAKAVEGKIVGIIIIVKENLHNIE